MFSRHYPRGDPAPLRRRLKPERLGDSGVIALVSENDDAFGLQELSGVPHALGTVVLLSDGQYDLSSHDLVLNVPEQLANAPLATQLIVEDRRSRVVIEVKEQILR